MQLVHSENKHATCIGKRNMQQQKHNHMQAYNKLENL